MANLFGTGINQVPTNGMLGNLAFQDKAYVSVDKVGIGTTAVDTGTANQTLQNYGGAYVSGNLGVGSTNPTSTLQVTGTFYNSGIGTFANGNTTYGTGSASSLELGINNNNNAGTLKIWGATSNAYGIIQATTSNLHIDTVVGGTYLNYYDGDFISFGTGAVAESARFTGSTGTLTLGTITPTGTASQPLQVSGGAYVSGNLGVGNTNGEGIKLFVSQGAPATNRPVALITDDGTIPTMTGGATLRISNDGSINSFALLEAESSVGRLVFTNAGNLGIGTTNPGATLNVVPTATSIAGLFSGTTSSDMVRITQLGNGNALVVEDEANPDANPFVVTGVGTVGIGITNPSIKLTVNGGLDSSNRQVRFVNSGTGDLYIKHANLVSSIEAGSSVQLALGGNGAEVVRINSTGVGIGTTNPQDTLDVGLGTIRLYNKSVPTRFSQIYQDGALTFKNSAVGDDFQFVASSNSLMVLKGSGPLILPGTASLTGTSSQLLQVTGGAYVSGNLGIGTTNPTSKLTVQGDILVSGITTVGFITATNIWNAGITTSSRITLNGANDTTTGGGQIYLNGATGNRIDFNTNGVAIPSTGTRSVGTKIVLYPGVGGSTVDYGLGIESATLWYSVPSATNAHTHRWYGSTTQLADLKGSGEFLLGSTSIVSSAKLQVTGGAYVSDSVGIGTTNPTSKLDVVGDGNFTGVVTASSFSGNASSSTYATSAGIATYATSSGIATYATTAGVSTSVIGGIGSIAQLQVTGVSTFSNGPVLIGSATSTGTESQRLQVTGGAYFSGTGGSANVGVGTTNPQYIFTVTDTGTPATVGLTNCLADFTTTANSYGQINLRNTSSGTNASGDIVITADNGSDTTNFIDLGINNSGFSVGSWTINGANDGYLYTSDGNLSIGAINASVAKYISFFTGGTLISNERMRINSTGVAIGTTQGTGTASQLLQVAGGAYISGNLGVGATNPVSVIEIIKDWGSSSSTNLSFTATSYADGSRLVLRRANGTPSAPTTILSGQELGNFNFRGHDGTSFTSSGLANIGADAEENYTTGSKATRLRFGTTNVNETVVSARMYLTGAGNLLIGTATTTGTSSQLLQVAGGAYVSGNLGVGTTNPSQSLHVQGNARVTGAVYDSTNSPGTSGQVLSSTVTGTQWTTAASGGGTSTLDILEVMLFA